MKTLLSAALVVSIGACSRPALASWPSDSLTNVPVCTAISEQNRPAVASDGVGGAFIAWDDTRADGAHHQVYLQHVTADGLVAPGWPANGLVVAGGQIQSHPAAVEDGLGGVIVVWLDDSGPLHEGISAQRVASSGTLQWGTNGVPTGGTTNAGNTRPAIISDEAGGVIIVWQGFTAAAPVGSEDVYAQRVLTDGTLAWGIDALQVAVGWPVVHFDPALASDGGGGAFMAWSDSPTQSSTKDIHAQHVSSGGTLSWQTGGIPVCTATKDQRQPVMAQDGAGGAFVAWKDSRNDPVGFDYGDVYMQHLTAAGVDPSWPTDGLGVETDPNQHVFGVASAVADEAGGVIAVWSGLHIYAQRVDAAGTPLWAANGVPLSTASAGPASCVSDGAGGAIVPFVRSYSIPVDPYTQGTEDNVRVQHISGGGSALWGPDGTAVSFAQWNQNNVSATADGAGGAILAWHDARSDTGDVYAQNVNANGSLGGTVVAVALSLVSADAGPDGVALEWFSPDASLASAQLERTQDGATWSELELLQPDGSGRLRYVDRDVAPGARYGYRLATGSGTQTDYTATTWVTVPAAYDLALAAPRPNPAVNEMSLQFTLPTGTRARIELVDLAGRVVRSLVDQSLAAGQHTVRWDLRDDTGRPVPDGVYFARFKSLGRALVQRAVVIR